MISILDRFRFGTFSWLLRYKPFQLLYTKTYIRHLVSFILLTGVNFLIALNRPDLLLLLGPLIYGYFHLYASYLYITPEDKPKSTFKLFLGLTVLTILIRLTYLETELAQIFVNGFLELCVAILFFMFLKKNQWKNILSYILCGYILYWAWDFPLEFVSASLFIHNWVAFFYWLIFSKNKPNFIVALIGCGIFFVIHYLVFVGDIDTWINFEFEKLFGLSNASAISWVLTPWTDDVTVGKRALVLYSFGLAMHYFVWLKAIPENRQLKSTPNSFKYSFTIFKTLLGKKFFERILVFTTIMTLFWAFFPKYGAYVYFLIAGVHAWTELVMLIPNIKQQFAKLG